MGKNQTAVILHGTMGSPEGNWFPWLKDELGKKKWQVVVPQFPTPENHSLETWMDTFKIQEFNLDEIDLLVGHSLGANLILHILESGLCKPEKVILVGCIIEDSTVAEYNQLNKSFKKKFDWNAIRSNVKKSYILHGNNDPYVPLQQAQDVANGLSIKLEVIKNGGHLNLEHGYDNFPRLLELIDA